MVKCSFRAILSILIHANNFFDFLFIKFDIIQREILFSDLQIFSLLVEATFSNQFSRIKANFKKYQGVQ